MLNEESHDIAAKMLGQPAPERLKKKLDEVNELCRRAGGVLMSRQVIALVVDAWLAELRIPEEIAFTDLEAMESAAAAEDDCESIGDAKRRHGRLPRSEDDE